MATFAALLFAVLCIVCLTDAHVFTEDERELFKNIHFEQLPQDLKLALMKKERSSESGWCCISEKPLMAIQHSKIVSQTTKRTMSVNVGYKKCGFGGWKRCGTYAVRYQNIVTYSKAYYEVPDKSKCAEKDLKCCNGNILIAGNCMELSVAIKYKETLKALKDQNRLDLVG
ncbi:uncharacterized protein LOC135469720 [Liolophura sinensis]|uniref:uncharacterized protein LOC135469720 n=1 Tax=Liolophura sinensis TaxID=3198878 RepID=UPI0031582267